MTFYIVVLPNAMYDESNSPATYLGRPAWLFTDEDAADGVISRNPGATKYSFTTTAL